MTAPALNALDAALDAVPGTVSVWCGPLGGPPAFVRNPDTTHYAASTMKVSVLAALYRAAEDGTLDLDAEIPLRNEFASAAPGAPVFGCSPDEDSDDLVWARLGGSASLRWIAQRMIVVSGNLATNICLSVVGRDAVAEVWRLVGAEHSVVGRGIEDSAAREAGISNLVTAADLAALMSAIASKDARLARPETCEAMLDVLLAQEMRADAPAGLPEGTRIAHKNGWITGIRHNAAVIFPEDADPYTLVCCTTTPLANHEAGKDDGACALLARIAAASWQDRHLLNRHLLDRDGEAR